MSRVWGTCTEGGGRGEEQPPCQARTGAVRSGLSSLLDRGPPTALVPPPGCIVSRVPHAGVWEMPCMQLGEEGQALACSLPGGDGAWRGVLVALPWREPQPGTASPGTEKGLLWARGTRLRPRLGLPCARTALGPPGRGRALCPARSYPLGPCGSPPAGGGGRSNSSGHSRKFITSLVLEQNRGGAHGALRAPTTSACN